MVMPLKVVKKVVKCGCQPIIFLPSFLLICITVLEDFCCLWNIIVLLRSSCIIFCMLMLRCLNDKKMFVPLF